MRTNRIIVSVLCGRGETAEALEVIKRVNDDPLVNSIIPLFPAAPEKCGGRFLLFPPAAQNRRGAARAQIVTMMAKSSADIFVILDDDTMPNKDYFKILRELDLEDEPTLITGRLHNKDGSRCWDVCAFQNKKPIIVPYNFIEHPSWTPTLYFSGPQHIFNNAGIKLAAKTNYPDLTYGEDTHFCKQFREAGGFLRFEPNLEAHLLHQHNPPNELLLWNT